MLAEMLPVLMFACLVLFIFTGLPVAAVLGGVSLVFAGIGLAMGEIRLAHLPLLVNRIFSGIVSNSVMVAVPMFVLMGTLMEKSGIAEDLLEGLQTLMRRVPGGLAIAVTMMGTILAASTGIIGASVAMLTLLALPMMLRSGYAPSLATGTIAASGTLGILIPPSIMLVIMGDLLTVSVGKLFMAALIPGLMLSGFYLLYIVTASALRPKLAPRATEPLSAEERRELFWKLSSGLLPPALLIGLVLGSILGGFATPTEASGVGALGALALALFRRRLSLGGLHDVLTRSLNTVAMIFFIFVGATAFSYLFRRFGGEHLVLSLADASVLGPWGVLAALMLLIFVLGFFFDWIEITLIILPIFAPIVAKLDFGAHVASGDAVYWFAILVALNLQTSFLTPPFGFALFYLKGTARALVSLKQIYRGIIPFVILQLLALAVVVTWPEVAMWLPNRMFD
ncbi:TRAP transporter large permease [Stappia sp.]|jgi:tripartite ATP-independent transporter DctM subunit|uniref:TRAP transporter large permease n=1 Tax=Stappia sp. TaxID=1870903 RepID=UPI003A99F6A2